MARYALVKSLSGPRTQPTGRTKSEADAAEVIDRVWLRRSETAFKQLRRWPTAKAELEKEPPRDVELAPRLVEAAVVDLDTTLPTTKPASEDEGFSRDAVPSSALAAEDEGIPPEKHDARPTPAITADVEQPINPDAPQGDRVPPGNPDILPTPAITSDDEQPLPPDAPQEVSPPMLHASSSIMVAASRDESYLLATSLKERLQAAVPLPTKLLPRSGTRDVFVDGFRLVGVDVAESLAEASSALSGARVQVNSEGAVFFLFFTKGVDRDGAEFVMVLKFTGTDIRTRAECFANTLAKGLGVATPPTSLIVKVETKRVSTETDNWGGLSSAVETLITESTAAERLRGELARAKCGLVMGFVPGSSLAEVLAQRGHDEAAMISRSCQIGRCFVLDLALRNSDRLPCSTLGWRGNTGNVLVHVSPGAIPILTALDTTCPRAPPSTATRSDPETYEAVIRAAFSDEDSASLLLRELSFDSIVANTSNNLVRPFISGVSDGLRRLAVMESYLDESVVVVRKLLAGVTIEVAALQGAESSGVDENVVQTSSRISSQRGKSPGRKISPSFSAKSSPSISPNRTKTTPTKISPASRTSPAMKRLSPVLGTPPLTTSSHAQSPFKTPTRRLPSNAKKPATPGGQPGGNTKMAMVRAVHEQCLSREASPDAEAFVAKWRSKFAVGAIEVDILLGKAIAAANGGGNDVVTKVTNGFLDFGPAPGAMNGIIGNVSDVPLEEGLVCAESAFELHIRLKHLIPRATLIREIAATVASVNNAESKGHSDGTPRGSTF